jgi:hypothetical protein
MVEKVTEWSGHVREVSNVDEDMQVVKSCALCTRVKQSCTRYADKLGASAMTVTTASSRCGSRLEERFERRCFGPVVAS